MEGTVDAAGYEALGGVGKAEYEQRVRESVWDYVAVAICEATPLGGPKRTYPGVLALLGGSVESVRVERTGSDTSIVVLFHMNERPDHLFGFRRAIWPALRPDAGNREGTPEANGGFIGMHLQEDIETKWWYWKDRGPDSDGVVWVGEPPPQR